MSIETAWFAITAIAMPPLILWFYPHCARGGLAMLGARPAAFVPTVFATLVAFTASVVDLFDFFISFAPQLDHALNQVRVLEFAFVVPAAAFLVPNVFVRVTGGPDPTVPVRYVITWHRRRWRRKGYGSLDSADFVRWLRHSLSTLKEPADRALIDEWDRELEGVIQASDISNEALGAAIAELHGRVVKVRLVEPLGDLL